MTGLFWASFVFLLGWTLAITTHRRRAFSRSQEDWWIDLVNLGVHLWVLPLFQVTVLLKAFAWLLPAYQARWSMGVLGSFFLYVTLDYLWYWNHRLLHSYTWVWNLHAVHHSATQVDLFTTARNSIWSHAIEIYMWFIAIAVYVLKDPSAFLAFVVLGSISNFWTHTEFTFSRGSKAYAWVSKVLITPHEHLWHHSTSHSRTNFATVFSFWDRLHGTLHAPAALPESYGNSYLPGALRQLFFPVPLRK